MSRNTYRNVDGRKVIFQFEFFFSEKFIFTERKLFVNWWHSRTLETKRESIFDDTDGENFVLIDKYAHEFYEHYLRIWQLYDLIGNLIVLRHEPFTGSD